MARFLEFNRHFERVAMGHGTERSAAIAIRQGAPPARGGLDMLVKVAILIGAVDDVHAVRAVMGCRNARRQTCCESPKIVSTTVGMVKPEPPIGAVGPALRKRPGGHTTSMGLKAPSLAGPSGENMYFAAIRLAATAPP